MDVPMKLDSSPSPPTLRRPPSELSLKLTLTPCPPPPNPPLLTISDLQSLKSEERGLWLVQLLLTCTAHAADSDLPRADACLRLISALSSPTGDSMQRLASRLACSLASRLLRRRFPGLLASLTHHGPPTSHSTRGHLAFARSLPYLPFAHAVTACTLLRSLDAECVVHLVDLGASPSSGKLWAPLLRSLSLLPSGPPHLKLTCVSHDSHVLDSLGSALFKEADSLDVSFQFHPVNSSLTQISPDSLRVKTGEALAVVSILSLHQLLAGPDDEAGGRRVEEFLSAVRSMSPKVVVVVEQEADHNSGRVVERFVEALHYYSAMFDSVESTVGVLGEEERAAVEEVVGREMENVVACEGQERVERHERKEKWVRRMGSAGFRQARVWYDAAEEGRRVVEEWPSAKEGGSGYGLLIDGGCLMICWHDRPLYTVSVWQS